MSRNGTLSGGRAPRRLRALALVAAAAAVLVLALAGCSGSSQGTEAGSQQSDPSTGAQVTDEKSQTFKPQSGGDAKATLKIASGSENREAADAIQSAVNASGVAVQLDYMGSVDIMKLLQGGGGDYDAVWPASSMWISLGDTKHVVKDAKSTSTTPVVLGVQKKLAEQLGWVDSAGKTKAVPTADIVKAVQDGKLDFAMTSATQSNSGASAYLAFLQALSGKTGPLTTSDLDQQPLRDQVTKLLSGVDRSSGSSDWLKDMVVKDPDAHKAMINYESLVSAADRELVGAGKDPLVAIYPADGIAVSDSPLGFVDRGQGHEDDFVNFQKALSSDDAKLLLERAGRRTGLGGVVANKDDSKVKEAFRSDWGLSTDASVLKAAPLPSADVLKKALDLYQTDLRKPSYTVWVVDYSGSMRATGKDQAVAGLNEALDPTKASQNMLQPGSQDVNVFIPFSDEPGTPSEADGQNTDVLLSAAQKKAATGGTDIYKGLEAGFEKASEAKQGGKYTVAVVLMTDGMSETDSKQAFFDYYKQHGEQIPVFSIMFGEAQAEQLDELSKLTNGKTFDGRQGDLADVFRQVKGYN